jgi:hypothetical protein
LERIFQYIIHSNYSTKTKTKMKKLIYVLILAVMAMACQEESFLTQQQKQSLDLGPNATSSAPITNYTTAASYVNSYSFSTDFKTLTITVDKSAASAKAISHAVFKFNGVLSGKGCTSEPLTLANITAFTANGVDMMGYLGTTEGQNDCYGMLADPIVKLGQGFTDPVVVFAITFDVPVIDGTFLIKAGSANSPTGGGCFGLNDPNYSFSRTCVVEAPKCYKDDTAWGAGTRYVARGNWATYTTYVADGLVNLYAGQNKWAGVVTTSAIIDGNVTITVTLNDGWSLQEVSNPVKIQGYTAPPSGNPSPGRFTSKGSSLTVTVPAAKYYGIHLDVRQTVECPQ